MVRSLIECRLEVLLGTSIVCVENILFFERDLVYVDDAVNVNV